MADGITSETLTRAERAGLRRDDHGWSRHNTVRLVARADDGRWWWAPEGWVWGAVRDGAPRYVEEEQALSAALDWVEAMAPLGPVPPGEIDRRVVARRLRDMARVAHDSPGDEARADARALCRVAEILDPTTLEKLIVETEP